MPITHSVVATEPDDPTAEVKSSGWNADHVLPDVEELPTAETDTTKVLSPDGTGGVTFVAGGGGGLVADPGNAWAPSTAVPQGYGILVGGYVFLALAENPAILVVGFLILGLFPALTDGVQRALAADLSATDVRGGALGLVNGVSGLGLLFAGIGGGYVWAHFGANTALFTAGLFVLAGIALLLTVPRHESATMAGIE